MERTPNEELQQIEREYQQRRAEIEQRMQEQGESKEEAPASNEHETLSKVVEEKIQEHDSSFQASSHQPNHGVESVDPERQAKLRSYLDIAFTESLSKAIKGIKDLNDPAMTDAFHGEVTTRLYKELIDRKKMEVVQ